MSEMVERVARLLNPDLWKRYDWVTTQGEAWQKEWMDAPINVAERDASISQAREIIMAMREPTEAIEEAFWSTYPIDCGPIPIWQAMIDGALK